MRLKARSLCGGAELAHTVVAVLLVAESKDRALRSLSVELHALLPEERLHELLNAALLPT